MNARRSSSTTRNELLEAAVRVVIEHGAAGMTLEAVAEEAGVSKGGLLYHFPKKDALLEGITDAMLEGLSDRINRAYDEDAVGGDRGRFLRALIAANFESADQDLATGLIAVLLMTPELLDRHRLAYEARQTLIEQDGIDTVTANIIRLAGDGIWFSELLGFAPPSEPLKTQIRERLVSLTLEGPP